MVASPTPFQFLSGLDEKPPAKRPTVLIVEMGGVEPPSKQSPK